MLCLQAFFSFVHCGRVLIFKGRYVLGMWPMHCTGAVALGQCGRCCVHCARCLVHWQLSCSLHVSTAPCHAAGLLCMGACALCHGAGALCTVAGTLCTVAAEVPLVDRWFLCSGFSSKTPNEHQHCLFEKTLETGI